MAIALFHGYNIISDFNSTVMNPWTHVGEGCVVGV